MRKVVIQWSIAALLMGAIGVGLVGCRGAQEAQENGDSEEAQTQRTSEAELRLASSQDNVRTIQLYRGSNERNLPIISLQQSSAALTLEFDLMEPSGRPFSVYFYHADRTWRRDLSPSQYLSSFQNDNVLDYTSSRGTDVDYVHYEYQFPNDNIDFRISGNYIVRVTEQGQEDQVLFERAFFITEQAGPLELGVDDIVVSGQRQPSDQPIARFTPPSQLQGDPFQYETCFVRNAQFDKARCSSRPRLSDLPALEFNLLRERAFAPATSNYFLDLSNLNVGGSVERIDRSVSPYRVLLAPDHARFANTPLAPRLNGQTVVGDVVRDAGTPDVEGQYVTVRFGFVPPEEQPFSREVVVAGSFTGGQYDDDYRMRWVPERGRYEGEVLLKQGQYEYYYDSADPALQRVIRESLPPMQEQYTAFVYYSDHSLSTDRLVAVQSVQTK